MPLLVKGDVHSLGFEDGRSLELPRGWGMVHDPSGQQIGRCTVLLMQYSRASQDTNPVTDIERNAARDYFGKGYEPVRVILDFPIGKWQSVGRITEVRYARRGKFRGEWRHQFKQAVRLCIHASPRAYKLELPADCVLDVRGFVRP